MSGESPEYQRGCEAASAYFFDIHARVEKAAKAGVKRILAKMREHPGIPVYAYLTRPGETDAEVVAVAFGEATPPEVTPVSDVAIARVPEDYLYGYLFQRLRALPLLAPDKH